MYLPPLFREDRRDVQHEVIRRHPLGMLVTAGPGGLLANPIPILIDSDASERGTLQAHLARANPQWRELTAVEQCLVIFQGPEAYVTPAWYATKRETGKVAPTWNYVVVQTWGRPRVIEGKWKVSQNRPEADRAGVVAGFCERGAEAAEMSALVAERGQRSG